MKISLLIIGLFFLSPNPTVLEQLNSLKKENKYCNTNTLVDFTVFDAPEFNLTFTSANIVNSKNNLCKVKGLITDSKIHGDDFVSDVELYYGDTKEGECNFNLLTKTNHNGEFEIQVLLDKRKIFIV